MNPATTLVVNSHKLKIILISIFLMTVIDNGFGQLTNLATGLWSNTLLWSNNQLPGSNDSVYLNYDITVDISAVCKALNTNGHNVTINTGVNLNIITSPVDIDGTVYNTVAICNQLWTRENLNVAHYRNGDTIPQVTDHTQWLNLTTGAWCYYNNDPANGAVYGKLYNWYAIHDPRGIAPIGWHIPGETEWTTLIEDCLGGNFIAGGTMKETGLAHWADPNTGTTNSSGFTGLPGGSQAVNGDPFSSITTYGYWWSITEADITNGWIHTLLYDGGCTSAFGFDKRLGLSIRCIKD